MAKRRNLKKEKALRNQAYARRFRKKSNNSRFGKRRYGGNGQSGRDGDMDRAGESGETGAADTI